MEIAERPMKGCKSGVEVARLAFLYGEGDGKPVASTQRLAEIAGMREQAIRKHMPAWIKEKEGIVANGSKTSLALYLSNETLTQSKKDINTLRDNCDILATSLETFDGVNKILLDFMQNFEDDKEYALRIFENFVRGVNARANILKEFRATRSDWAKAAGVDAYSDVQVAGAKALTVARAKMESKSNSEEQLEDNSVSIAFKKRLL